MVADASRGRFGGREAELGKVDLAVGEPPGQEEGGAACRARMEPRRSDAIDRDVPAESLARILQTPYGLQSYDPNGLSADQFNAHPATVYTVADFSRSASGLDEYVAARLAAKKSPS